MQPLLSLLTTSSSDSCCPEFPIPAWAVDLTFALQFTSFFILTTASETESRNTCRGRREEESERGRERERGREEGRERERGREGGRDNKDRDGEQKEEWRGREVEREEREGGGGGGERDLLNQSKCMTMAPPLLYLSTAPPLHVPLLVTIGLLGHLGIVQSLLSFRYLFMASLVRLFTFSSYFSGMAMLREGGREGGREGEREEGREGVREE